MPSSFIPNSFAQAFYLFYPSASPCSPRGQASDQTSVPSSRIDARCDVLIYPTFSLCLCKLLLSEASATRLQDTHLRSSNLACKEPPVRVFQL